MDSQKQSTSSLQPKSPTPERPFRVAVIGSGPSGFYSVEALLGIYGDQLSCDIFDRLPTPFGLVRGGVAPDHQSIKRVASHYERIASKPNVRFFGNVQIGAALTSKELHSYYDAVIYAVGNERDRHLKVPGMDLPGCYSATGFVGWYNGHPDFKDHIFNLNHESIAVIGIGNVAIDVARVLARDPNELAMTDIAEYVIPAFKKLDKLKRVYVIGRRGPAQAAFTIKELKEIANLANADLIIDPTDIAADRKALEEGRLEDPKAKQIVKYLADICDAGPQGKPRQLILRFFLSPIEFLAGPDGRMASIQLEQNELQTDESGALRAKGTGRMLQIKAGAAFKAVGYRGIAIPGLPFDKKTGTIPNIKGRITETADSKISIPGNYVVGWAKRGPSGLIGTNKQDAIETASSVAEDFPFPLTQPPHLAQQPALNAISNLLKERDIRFVTFEEWKRIDEAEVTLGKERGKIREKFTSVNDTIDFLGS